MIWVEFSLLRNTSFWSVILLLPFNWHSFDFRYFTLKIHWGIIRLILLTFFNYNRMTNISLRQRRFILSFVAVWLFAMDVCISFSLSSWRTVFRLFRGKVFLGLFMNFFFDDLYRYFWHFFWKRRGFISWKRLCCWGKLDNCTASRTQIRFSF